MPKKTPLIPPFHPQPPTITPQAKKARKIVPSPLIQDHICPDSRMVHSSLTHVLHQPQAVSVPASRSVFPVRSNNTPASKPRRREQNPNAAAKERHCMHACMHGSEAHKAGGRCLSLLTGQSMTKRTNGMLQSLLACLLHEPPSLNLQKLPRFFQK